MALHGGWSGEVSRRRVTIFPANTGIDSGHCAAAGMASNRARAAVLYFRRMAHEAQLQLLSRYENIELVEKVLSELCGTAHVNDEVTYWVGMAMREALANAIKHGNKLNPEKRVYVEITVEPEERLEIVVEDEGEGFEPDRVADPTVPTNLLRSSGRGVFYMRQFMDDVVFTPGERGGTRIRLGKRLSVRRDDENKDS